MTFFLWKLFNIFFVFFLPGFLLSLLFFSGQVLKKSIALYLEVILFSIFFSLLLYFAYVFFFAAVGVKISEFTIIVFGAGMPNCFLGMVFFVKFLRKKFLSRI